MAAMAVAGPVTSRADCPSGSLRRVTWRRSVGLLGAQRGTDRVDRDGRRPNPAAKSAGVRVDASPSTRWQTARAAAGSSGSVSWASARACG